MIVLTEADKTRICRAMDAAMYQQNITTDEDRAKALRKALSAAIKTIGEIEIERAANASADEAPEQGS